MIFLRKKLKKQEKIMEKYLQRVKRKSIKNCIPLVAQRKLTPHMPALMKKKSVELPGRNKVANEAMFIGNTQ